MAGTDDEDGGDGLGYWDARVGWTVGAVGTVDGWDGGVAWTVRMHGSAALAVPVLCSPGCPG